MDLSILKHILYREVERILIASVSASTFIFSEFFSSDMIKLLANLSVFIFRRGQGLFKFLFVIDDFIRVFAIAILLPMLMSWLGLSKAFQIAGFILGIIIDMQDFVTEFGPGKIISKKDLWVIREKYGLFKILFVIDDFFRAFVMTILISVLLSYFNIGGVFFFLLILLGMAIDIHDLYETFSQGKLIIDKSK